MNNSNPLQLALMHMQQQDYASARSICQQRLALKPKDFNARHLLGLINLHAGDPDAARQALALAAKLPVAARYRAQALSNLSLALGQLDRVTEALDAINQALRLQPDEAAFHLNRLNLLEQQQAWSSILAAARDWPALNQLPDAQYALVRAERELGLLQEALHRLEPLSTETPLELIGEWALLRLRLNEQQQVRRHFMQQPIDQLAYAADYLAEQGERATALLLYRLLLERKPDHAGARHMVDAAEGRLGEAAPATYVRALYDTHAARFEQHLVNRLGYRAPTRLATCLAERLRQPLARVADLGCGSGLLGVALRQQLQIDELYGCDLSEAMLEQAERKQVYDRLERAELSHWLRRQQPFDLICACDVLIYIGDLGPLLSAVAQRLRADGCFAFTVECCEQALEITPSGRYRHSASHIRQRAAAAGLQLVSCEPFPLRCEEGRQLTGLMVLCQPQLPQGADHE